MHMWHHVTNHLIISNDKDSNSENQIKLRVRDKRHNGLERSTVVLSSRRVTCLRVRLDLGLDEPALFLLVSNIFCLT
jgi:hypothetical protein